MESFVRLQERIRELYQIGTAVSIIRWDLQTYMPPRGLKQRSDQLALLSKITHRLATDIETISLVEKLEADKSKLNLDQKRELQLFRRDLNKILLIPEDVIVAESKQRAVATRSWNRAKDTNNWKLFESDLITLLDISKKRGEFMMEGTGASSPYDALMNVYEPRMTSAKLTKIFRNLRKRLVRLVETYTELCSDVRLDFLDRRIPIETQRKLARDLASYVGFDTNSNNAGGRIDEAEHPFTTGYYDDVRMTVNYSENQVFRVVFGTLHEVGHSLYRQNLNPDWKWMVLGDICSSGIGESQSRFVENIIGRSQEFWIGYLPKFHKLTNGEFNDITFDDFVKAINIVRPSKIRGTADEMTYALHIIIRFEIEQDLFRDKLSVAEIPAVWNEKYNEYLGVTVETDKEGALQDTHWAWGMWGYFPTYCLGNLYSAMIAEKLNQDLPVWKNDVAEGNLSIPINWLAENVHRMSNRYDPSELIERITGKSLTIKPFIKYLKGKYSTLYN